MGMSKTHQWKVSGEEDQATTNWTEVGPVEESCQSTPLPQGQRVEALGIGDKVPPGRLPPNSPFLLYTGCAYSQL